MKMSIFEFINPENNEASVNRQITKAAYHTLVIFGLVKRAEDSKGKIPGQRWQR